MQLSVALIGLTMMYELLEVRNTMRHVSEESQVLTEQRGQLGLITLNRPRVMNALTHEMVQHIVRALDDWRDDPLIHTVAIVGAGDRGLCAGGDIIALRNQAIQGEGSGAAAFWADEYEMNALIAEYPKPVVAVQDGLVLGGGIGVSGHASHRIVTERSQLGFPEVSIGFVPDVGASWLLTRAPGLTGLRIALTGESVGAADAIYLGLSDVYVTSERLPELLTALETQPVDTVLPQFVSQPVAAKLETARVWIDEAFDHDSVVDILVALNELAATGNSDAKDIAQIIATKSPVALATTLALLRKAVEVTDLVSALDVEYRVTTHLLTHPDFAEGVRAQVIDKDRNPRWSPASLEEVTPEQVKVAFHNTSHGTLNLHEKLTMRKKHHA